MIQCPQKKACGFSLIEVMVALIVICVGMLGIAKMQALAMSSTNVASMRGLAAIEASSLASAMHANRAFWSIAAVTPTTTTVNPDPANPTNGGTIVSSVAGLAATPPSCMYPSSPCSPVSMAATDLITWKRSLANLLPGSQAVITCSAQLPVDCTIQINWAENAVALTKQESDQAATNLANGVTANFQAPLYTLYVEP